MSDDKDGGPVVGTGGGKFGAPVRWKRPKNAREGAVVWMATVMVGGIGKASYGVRTAAAMDLMAGGVDGGGAWKVYCDGRTVTGIASSVAAAQSAAVGAAKALADTLAARPRESEQHPPMGPAVWPGV